MDKKNLKFIKLTITTFENASRDKRELSVIDEFDNVDIKVFAKGEVTGIEENVDGYNVHRISTKPLGEKYPVMLNRICSIFTWAHIISKEKADIISGHDMIALFIGYLSNIFKKKEYKAKLVYDSHEFELGRNAERSNLKKKVIEKLEKFLIKKSIFSIMVNDIIADEVKNIYNLEERPVVIRNIPNYWNLDFEKIDTTRKNILSQFNNDNDFVAMYHGAIFENRGIEEMLEVIRINKNINFIILGNGDVSYIDNLKQKSYDKQINDRVMFHEAVPIEKLYRYVAAVDVGIITIPGKHKSYYYMLPNKFFENIQALTPVIISDFPAVGEIVDKYDIGIKVDPNNIKDIASAVQTLQEDKELYAKYKNNLMIAKEELCWENEKGKLYEAYNKIINKV